MNAKDCKKQDGKWNPASKSCTIDKEEMIFFEAFKIYSKKDNPFAFDVHYKSFKKLGKEVSPPNKSMQILETKHYFVWVEKKKGKPSGLFYVPKGGS